MSSPDDPFKPLLDAVSEGSLGASLSLDSSKSEIGNYFIELAMHLSILFVFLLFDSSNDKAISTFVLTRRCVQCSFHLFIFIHGHILYYFGWESDSEKKQG